MTIKVDVEVQINGSVALIVPITSEAKAWIADNLEVEDWQITCGGIAVEPRMVNDIVDAMREHGVVVAL
jgi:hypothetical protein